MQHRVMSLALALGAFVLFYLLFIGSPAGLQGVESRPTTDATDANGYAGARAWLAQQGIAVRSLRERYTNLVDQDIAPTGNVLVVTLPGAAPFRAEEFAPLDQWVRSGNTLVLLAALLDTPFWSEGRKSAALAEIESLSSLEFEALDAPEESRPEEAVTIVLQTSGSHPLTVDVQALTALSTTRARPWLLRTPYDSFALSLVTDQQTGEGALFLRESGRGRIVVATAASLFSNAAIARTDNARLLGNLVAYSLGEQGVVLFDDLRQGVSASYDPAQFWRDSRLHWTFVVLVLVWLAWVTGGTNLRVPRSSDSVPNTTALVVAAGGMLSRRVRPAVAARRLFEQFFGRVVAQAGGSLPVAGTLSESVWLWLQRRGQLADDDIVQLQHWHDAAWSERRIPLRRLHNLLLRIDRQLFNG